MHIYRGTHKVGKWLTIRRRTRKLGSGLPGFIVARAESECSEASAEYTMSNSHARNDAKDWVGLVSEFLDLGLTFA